MSLLTASLGMYDHPAIRPANDALWTAIAERLRAAGIGQVPDRLDRGRPLETIWDDPHLLLAQTCGYPFMTRWRGRLRLVATLCYDAPGCDGATHRSRIVVRADEPGETLEAFRGLRAAMNDRSSNTGMNLFRAAVAPHAGGSSFFGAVVETGSHADSARLVASGGADITAIDCVTYAHLEKHEPRLTGGLKTLGWSEASPGLPLVTSVATPMPTLRILRQALRQALDDGALTGPLDRLLITGLQIFDPLRYRVILALERRASEAGYPELR